MVDEYVSERKGLVHTAFQLAAQLDLAEEVVFDAVLLMDRVMSTGTAHDSNLGNLFVAASLRVSVVVVAAFWVAACGCNASMSCSSGAAGAGGMKGRQCAGVIADSSSCCVDSCLGALPRSASSSRHRAVYHHIPDNFCAAAWLRFVYFAVAAAACCPSDCVWQ